MGGQFASNETVTIVGLKLRAIENVRSLGPVRKASQVEVSATDAIKLGMQVPIRESGDVKGSAPIAVVHPKALFIWMRDVLWQCVTFICLRRMRRQRE